ncbi:MAG: diguanylate cyclase [Pseudomonadota bacterium]
MHGKVLVIDPIATHRIMLRVKLASSQYDVLQAACMGEAMRLLERVSPDLILTSTELPDASATQIIAKLRTLGLFGKVPVLAISSDAGASLDRTSLLSLGYDDVLSRPFETGFLMARARSLLRSYSATSEWQLREGTSRALGFAEPATQLVRRARVRLVTDETDGANSLRRALCEQLPADVTLSGPSTAVQNMAGSAAPDAFVLVARQDEAAAVLDLLAALRSHSATRHTGILVLPVDGPAPMVAQMLDIGANDVAPFDASDTEIVLRLKALLARKRATDALRETVRNGVEAAVIDPLTGLHNRRYALPHVDRIAERAQATGKGFALMIADIDHFKAINDHHGHAAGDAVLVDVAERLRANLRAVDLVARVGGEEFLIVLPGITLESAKKAAHRLCHSVGDTPVTLPRTAQQVPVTISVGMIVYDLDAGFAPVGAVNAQVLIELADKALYDAKAAGRNRVNLHQAAAA